MAFNKMNDMYMKARRRDDLYATIITDLAISQVIPRETAEMLLGYEIPYFLHTPDGKSINDIVVKKGAKKAEKVEE